MKKFDYSTYLSPFTWRYGSEIMRQIWSEENKRKLWREIWVALAKAQKDLGLVTKKELDDLIKHKDDVDIERAHEIEKQVYHDLMAEVKTFAEQAKIGGGKVHLGATSMDIEDNVDVLRIKQSLEIIEQKIKELLKIFAQRITTYRDLPCMGYTHLQPAEPTTLGYRLAFYTQDLLFDLELLNFVKKNLKGKGIKGAVGTSASFIKLLDKKKAEEMEENVMRELEIEAVEIASQTAPRKIEFWVASLLSSIAQSLYKFAFDLRVMQSPGFGEWQEPFSKTQVGSSAMPFKKNPIKAEQICSLSKVVVNLSRVTWDNAAHMLMERTLDDSAARRVVIPEMFLAIDEMLTSATNIVDGLVINEKRIKKNLETYWPFSASEAVLMEAVKKGADRQKMHELLREISMKIWESVQDGKDNPMEELLIENPEIKKYLSRDSLKKLLSASNHVGNAPKKALTLVRQIKKILKI